MPNEGKWVAGLAFTWVYKAFPEDRDCQERNLGKHSGAIPKCAVYNSATIITFQKGSLGEYDFLAMDWRWAENCNKHAGKFRLESFLAELHRIWHFCLVSGELHYSRGEREGGTHLARYPKGHRRYAPKYQPTSHSKSFFLSVSGQPNPASFRNRYLNHFSRWFAQASRSSKNLG